jgi:hypothetical protein
MNILSRLKEKVTEYIDVYVKLIRINFIGRTAGLISYFMFAMICMLIVFCIIIFSGFGLVEVFMAIGVSKLWSFFLTVGIYLLLLLLVFASRRKLTRFFASSIIKVLTEDDEDNDSLVND